MQPSFFHPALFNGNLSTSKTLALVRSAVTAGALHLPRGKNKSELFVKFEKDGRKKLDDVRPPSFFVGHSLSNLADLSSLLYPLLILDLQVSLVFLDTGDENALAEAQQSLLEKVKDNGSISILVFTLDAKDDWTRLKVSQLFKGKEIQPKIYLKNQLAPPVPAQVANPL